ncbi:MAG: RluA family pseudouridine synthase, partial [Ruminiclostridium sp.]
MRVLELTAEEWDDGAEVGDFLRRHGFSRGIITKLKQGSSLLVNGKKARTVDILHKGDIIEAAMSDETG